MIGSVPAALDAYIAVSPDGSTFYTTLTPDLVNKTVMLEQVSVATLEVLNSVAILSLTVTSAGNPFAISPDGSTLAIFTQIAYPTVIFVALPSLTVGTSTPVGNACGVAYPTAARIAVTNCASDSVDVVDITTGTLVKRFDAGPSPQSTLTSPAESVIYVSNLYGVWALSTKSGNILSKVEFPGPYVFSTSAGRLALSADGATLFAEYPTGVLIIETSNFHPNGIVSGIPSGFNVSAIATSPDGKYLLVAGTASDFQDDYRLLLLDPVSGALISDVSAPCKGTDLVASKDSTAVYYEGTVGGILPSIYDFNLSSQTFTTISTPVFGAMVLSPDGTTLYVAGSAIEAINSTTFAMTALPSPVAPVEIGITPDGLELIVTSTASAMGVINIANPLIGATIPIGGATGGISVW